MSDQPTDPVFDAWLTGQKAAHREEMERVHRTLREHRESIERLEAKVQEITGEYDPATALRNQPRPGGTGVPPDARGYDA
jgi:hypothetical protein